MNQISKKASFHPNGLDYNMPYKVPILITSFNRPDLTIKVINSLRIVKPRTLYMSFDGARLNHPEDIEACEMTRAAVDLIDWRCELRTRFFDHNLGCKQGVSGAIDWFFNNENKGIILEDDCVPSIKFFPFMDVMLDRFENDESVMHISGSAFVTKKHDNSSYYYSNIPHVWGWASWKRAWENYSVNFNIDDALNLITELNRLFPDNRMFKQYWLKTFNRLQKGTLDTWDYQWTYAVWKSHGTCITPYQSLVTNIGFDNRATHTTTPIKPHKTGVSVFPLVHPEQTMDCSIMNNEIMKYNFNPTFQEKVTHFFKSLSSNLKHPLIK